MATDELRERASRLRDRVGQDYPDAWDFKELTEIVGVVQSLRSVDTDNGRRVIAEIEEVETGKRWGVWLSQRALYNRFAQLDIREGELVAIRYLGVGEASRPGFSPPHRFRVEVDRPGARFAWDGVTPDADTGQGRADHERAMASYDPPPGDDDIPF